VIVARPVSGLLAAVLACAAATADAEPPRSAIPWLSESLARPVATGALSSRNVPLAVEPITTSPIDGPERDAIGILPSETTGFARDLWGPTDLETARSLVLETRPGGVPEAQALLLRLLLAEARPPAGDRAGSTLLTARIDRLLKEGALEQADALILFAEPSEPDLFRRWFDIGLLTDNAEPACEALRRNPSLSPTLPARVFCLARGGDWNAAEITLTLGEEIGSIPEEQDAMLARFLDPVLFEEEPPPPVPDPLTPLDFLMREAVGLPRPPGQLPLAFLHHDLGEHTPMRPRIEAAERLVRSGAIGPDPLFAAYRAGAPAASGGFWDRAEAVQALDAALASGDAGTIETALARADTVLTEAGFRVALATQSSEALERFDPDGASAASRSRIFELLLLAGEKNAAARFLPAEPAPRQAALIDILGIGADEKAADTAPDDAAARAVRDAFAADTGGAFEGTPLGEKLAQGRQGEVILDAIDLLADGSETPPQSLALALRGLSEAGQDETARQIAAEVLLRGGLAKF
jgi:hypothetical protein